TNQCDAVPLVQPVLTAVNPAQGPSTGGILITLTGMNFRQGIAVQFNGIPTDSVSVISTTQLVVALPASPGACGLATVALSTPDGAMTSNSTLFAYKYGNIAFQATANPPAVDTNAKA